MSRILSLIPLLLAVSSPAWAQLSATVDAGATALRYGDTIRATALALTPAMRFEGAHGRADAVATVSQLDGSYWNAQGLLSLSVFRAIRGPFQGELIGSTAGSVQEDETRTARVLGQARVHALSANGGGWVGGGYGSADDGQLWRPLVIGELGAWARVHHVVLAGTLIPTRLGDSLRYADLEVSARLPLGRLDLTGSFGQRSGDRLFEDDRGTWGSAVLTAWVLPHVALVASGGTYPSDFTQGFPGGRYAGLAVRVGSARAYGTRTSARDVASVQVRPGAGSRRVLSIRAGRARTVEVAGDFTDWKPVMLKPVGGGWWEASLPLQAGLYHLNVRTDGGQWHAPPGIRTIRDEFGGEVSLLIVP